MLTRNPNPVIFRYVFIDDSCDDDPRRGVPQAIPASNIEAGKKSNVEFYSTRWKIIAYLFIVALIAVSPCGLLWCCGCGSGGNRCRVQGYGHPVRRYYRQSRGKVQFDQSCLQSRRDSSRRRRGW